MDVARLAGIRSPVTNAGAPAPARPPLQPGPAPLCQPLAEQLQVMSNAGYLGEAHLRAFGVVSTAEEFPEFVVGYRHPTRRWPPSSTGGNLNSAAALSHLQISSAADLGGSGSATGWPPARGPLSRARSIQPARRQVRGPRAWNARSSARSAKNRASTAPICEERSLCRRRPTPQPTAQRRAPSPARIKRRPGLQ